MQIRAVSVQKFNMPVGDLSQEQRDYLPCAKCEEKYNEKELETSHDIPKYIGGTDKDGRHWLCNKCHSQYDRAILMRIYLKIFNELIPYSEDRRSYIKYMSMIKKSSDRIKDKCKIISVEFCKEFFGGSGDANTEQS